MHLISALVAGLPDAANGVVQLFLRDTANRATWYSDFEGHGADSSGADIPLGSRGQKVVYVAALVDVVVKDSLGTTVREWTDGYQASCIELTSDSFTGINYDTAASAAGNPTTVGAAMNLWNNSAGAIDWKIGTGAQDLDDALVGASSLLFNVKAYGAVGDGVANDRASITSAIAAAVAAGGGEVFFPGGTYRIGSAITASAKVNLRGASPVASVILVDYASDASGAVRTTTADSDTIGNVVTQLTIKPAQSFTGPLLALARGSIAYQSVIGDPDGTVQSTQCVSYAGSADIFECKVNVVGAANVGVTRLSGTSTVRIAGGRLAALTASFTGDLVQLVSGTKGLISGVTFETNAGAAAGAAVAFSGNANELVMTGCRLLSSSSNVDFIDLGSDTSPTVHEVGNEYDSTNGRVLNAGTASLTASTRMKLTSRESRYYSYGNGSTTIDPLNCAFHYFNRTDNTTATITFNDAPPGCPLTIIHHNNHAGAGGTITFDTTRVDMSAASNQFSVAASSYRVFRFISALIDANLRWVEIGAATADEPE
jgi:hypothetical protein